MKVYNQVLCGYQRDIDCKVKPSLKLSKYFVREV